MESKSWMVSWYTYFSLIDTLIISSSLLGVCFKSNTFFAKRYFWVISHESKFHEWFHKRLMFSLYTRRIDNIFIASAFLLLKLIFFLKINISFKDKSQNWIHGWFYDKLVFNAKIWVRLHHGSDPDESLIFFKKFYKLIKLTSNV